MPKLSFYMQLLKGPVNVRKENNLPEHLIEILGPQSETNTKVIHF